MSEIILGGKFVKKLLVLLLVLCLLVTCIFTGSVFALDDDVDMNFGMDGETPVLTAKTYTIPEMEGKYKIQGRASVIDNILMTDYTASGMEFKANCSGDVSVTFNVIAYKKAYDATTGLGGCYFTIIVDGVKKVRDFCHLTETGDITVKIAENLEESDHTFEIYRQSEIELANVGIKSVTLTGELFTAPKENDMYIEFVGASQWGGYGNLATNSIPSVDVPDAYYQDGTQALTYLTARNLNADWSIVSVQGIGAFWGWQSTSMNTVYKYLRYNKDKNTLYDFSRQPDYVVIGLGTNDYSRMSYYEKTTDDLVNSFVDFMSLVREKNPNAKIIWVYNMMTSDVNSYVQYAVEKFGGKKANAYSFGVTKNTAGGKNHPDITGHKVMADEISAFITELEKAPAQPEDNKDNLISSDFDNWYTSTSASERVTYIDEDNNGVKDYVSVTTGENNSAAYVSTNPVTLVPDTEYELSYYARIPKDSAEYSGNIVDGATKNYVPKVAIYQPELNTEGTKVTSVHSESKNDYAYKGVRREAFTSDWKIGDYNALTRTAYSIYGSSHYKACNNVSPNVVYSDWTKVTITFKAIEDDNNKGPQVVAISMGVSKGVANLKFEVKDVVLKAKSNENTDVIIGDVTGNDIVDLEDVNALAQSLAGWNNSVINDVLDTNGDGMVNLKDLVILAQFVAGWDVKIGA